MPSFLNPRLLALGLLSALFHLSAYADDTPTLRLAVLKFGTANWEIDVIRHHQLDRKYGFKLDVTALASKQAAAIALQGKAVDMILSDWIWVSRQRNRGQTLTFFPYSRGVGGLVVPADSGIKNLADLQGKKIGIAGGPIDRNWLLVQALAKKQHGIDLDDQVEKVFGAPPLLYQKLLKGELDGVINFWHYVAKLEAKGMRTLISMGEIITELGFDSDTPMLGYVFNEEWAKKAPAAVSGMMAASAEAKGILNNSDDEWQRIRPLLRAEDEKEFIALREGFRKGVPATQIVSQSAQTEALYGIVAEVMKQYTSVPKALADGTFYQPPESQRDQN